MHTMKHNYYLHVTSILINLGYIESAYDFVKLEELAYINKLRRKQEEKRTNNGELAHA